MNNISPHFSRTEFRCRCGCGFDVVDKELLDVLQDIRLHFDSAVILNSACRCSNYNTAIAGAKKSQHIFGKAADIQVKGIPATRVADYLEAMYPSRYGIGRYASFTHIDVRDRVSRWQG